MHILETCKPTEDIEIQTWIFFKCLSTYKLNIIYKLWLALKVYYATFKVRKFELLFHKINTCLQKTATCIGLQAEQIFCQYRILGVVFVVPFLCYFQKLQLLVVKKFEKKICCLVLLFVWAQKVCLRFLKYYFKLEISIFLSFVVYFLVHMFN